MKSAIAIAIDGVLRREIGHQPIPEGLTLYRTLVNNWNVVLLSDEEPGGSEELDHFFHVEYLDQHSRVMLKQARYRDHVRVSQAIELRNTGMALAFVVEADPENSAALFGAGFNVMHFMHAQYARPDWRPDATVEITPWDELVAQEVAVKAAKAIDKRVEF